VGRFLEHERLYYFKNGGDEELLIGSADVMRRNLDRRVEVLVPVKDQKLRARVRDSILKVSLRDNMKCWELLPDGSYKRRTPAPGEEPFDSQEYQMTAGGTWREE
jgi:polyphosphate kinase